MDIADLKIMTLSLTSKAIFLTFLDSEINGFNTLQMQICLETIQGSKLGGETLANIFYYILHSKSHIKM